MDSLNQSLAAEREERERVEREREGVRGEVEREKRGKEEAEEKMEEMKKTLVEKNDDVQAKTKMIAKVSIHFFTYQPIAYLSLFVVERPASTYNFVTRFFISSIVSF